MFVVIRYPDEQFFIDPPGLPRITVKVLRVRDGAVRIGVDADRSIKIIREELDKEVQDVHA
jgi:carbon storage regulator CsrA